MAAGGVSVRAESVFPLAKPSASTSGLISTILHTSLGATQFIYTDCLHALTQGQRGLHSRDSSAFLQGRRERVDTKINCEGKEVGG